ncbi:hypothetical protein GYB22_04845 [bacterium]|nr:hypothetical protein [bacterium]
MNRITILLLVITLFSADSLAQNWGVGLRAGDPTGLTVKKYMGDNALELNVGRTYWWYGPGWYNRRFDYWYEGKKFGYDDFQYRGYRVEAPVAIQLHYLWQRDIGSIAGMSTPGLSWYYGLGGQFRTQTLYYSYRYKLDGPDWRYVEAEKVTDLDIGVDATIGLEYTFDKIPVSVFADGTLFIEIIDRPFYIWGQGGSGFRINF